jgi:hypothetical protein
MGRVGHPVILEEGSLRVASLLDLMATKLYAVIERVEPKDFTDIAAMCRAGVGMAEGMGAAKAMFGRDFDPLVCSRALTWFGDEDLDPLSDADKATLVEAVNSLDLKRLPRVKRVSKKLSLPDTPQGTPPSKP